MTSPKYYKVFCNTDNRWEYSWNATVPTTCPVNSGHDINADTIEDVTSRLDYYNRDTGQPREGHYMVEDYEFSIPSGTPGDITSHDHVADDDILLWLTTYDGTAETMGDSFDVIVNPDTTIGGLTAPASISDTTVSVSSTVIQNIVRGMYVTLDDGVNTQNIGKVNGIDRINSAIDFTDPLTFNFAPGTLVKINVYMARNIHIISLNTSPYGQKGLQGSFVPKGTTLRMFYKNNDGAAKTFIWKIGYYYGFTV